MKSLNQNEKELIFDYFLGFADEYQRQQASRLIQDKKGAAEFIEKLQHSLSPLKNYTVEQCPQHLTERTILRLNMAAQASQSRLEKLLKKEQNKSVLITNNRNFWSNFVEVAAIAAMIFIVAGVSFPTLQSARQNYWKTKCGAQLASVARGISQYGSDHNQDLPAVATAAGSPWWKVGYQGSENHSNTRHLWLLVQNKYVEPETFVCPARIQGKAVKLDRTQVPKLSDFPNRKYVTYSFRILSDKNPTKLTNPNKILIADVNPVFENLPQDFYKELDVKLGSKQLVTNSVNHEGCGQNVLFANGAVGFVRNRLVGTAQDDIFTLKNQFHYRGNETPASETDDFLAP